MLMIISIIKSLKIICSFNIFHVSFFSLSVLTSCRGISCIKLLDIYAFSEFLKFSDLNFNLDQF